MITAKIVPLMAIVTSVTAIAPNVMGVDELNLKVIRKEPANFVL
jgi:hypothetical protein